MVTALGKMFAPFCEVVLHDLRTPEHAIVAIENNLSGRRIGDATTNLGLERIASQDFPDIIQNYPNTLADGRSVKSTSIGIRNQKGEYIGSICLNFDISGLSAVTTQIGQFMATTTDQLSVGERLTAATAEQLQQAIMRYAAKKSLTPSQLSPTDKQLLVKELDRQGAFTLRGAISTTANLLRMTRPTIYKYLKEARND